jgi:hypothetical protein
MIEILLAGAAYFFFVFLKAFQQRNVMGMHYRWIMPISYMMAATEVFVISIVAIKAVNYTSLTDLITLALSVGTGGGLGALAGMYLHNRHVTNGK